MRFFVVALFLICSGASTAATLPDADPETLGFAPTFRTELDRAAQDAVERKQVPGVVVQIGRRGKIAYTGVFGERAVVPGSEPMTRDTIFDLASLTKPVATATSIMILKERGKLRLEDTLARLWPEFDNHGKGAITVEHLLRHRSGLLADNPIRDYADGPERAWERLANLSLLAPPGERFLYSDVNYLILGKLVERISGESLDQFACQNIFDRLGVGLTYLPPASLLLAPTEPTNGKMLRGEVHDPRARAIGGVAGHAGLFGTADDLAVFAQMILDEGQGPNGQRILEPEAVRQMIDPSNTPDGQRRGLGWDISTPFSGPRGKHLGPRSFGHTGFTGTSLWIDPDTRMFVIVLTSRLHPDGKAPAPTKLRAEIATIAAEALTDKSPPAPVP